MSAARIVADLADRAVERLGARPRLVVGLAGAPGSGKSTVTELLAAELERRAVPTAVAGMDGFHLAQAELERLGRAERKGAPDTFDAWGYLALLRRLREPAAGETVYAPLYLRGAVEQPIGSAVPIGAEVRVVLTEGNYLLLDEGPWTRVRDLLDESWFVRTEPALRRDRLLARHLANGKDEARARAFTEGSDERNAELVERTAGRAGRIVAWV